MSSPKKATLNFSRGISWLLKIVLFVSTAGDKNVKTPLTCDESLPFAFVFMSVFTCPEKRVSATFFDNQVLREKVIQN